MSDSDYEDPDHPNAEHDPDAHNRAQEICEFFRPHAAWLLQPAMDFQNQPEEFPGQALRLFHSWKQSTHSKSMDGQIVDADRCGSISRTALTNFCENQQYAQAWFMAMVLLEQHLGALVHPQWILSAIAAVWEVRIRTPQCITHGSE